MPEAPISAGLPRRFFLGAALAGISVAAATGLGLVGAGQQPSTDSFRFSRGVSFAPNEESRMRTFLAEIAANDRLGLRITGHTGTAGDADANLTLSLSRAQAAQDAVTALGIDESRVLFVGGMGGTAPRAKLSDEGDREYERALARVTIQTVRLP
jgi:outer membrane protein OmpA-like peptidoglycan-associated protein